MTATMPASGDQSESCRRQPNLALRRFDYVEPSDAEFVAALKAWREVLDQARSSWPEFYRLVTLFNAQNPQRYNSSVGFRKAKRAYGAATVAPWQSDCAQGSDN